MKKKKRTKVRACGMIKGWDGISVVILQGSP